MSKRVYYERHSRECYGRGTKGWQSRAGWIDEECPACNGKGYQRVRMPRRTKK